MHVYTPTKAKNKHNTTGFVLRSQNFAALACTSLQFTSITIRKWSFVDATGSFVNAGTDGVAKSSSPELSRELSGIWTLRGSEERVL